MSKKYWLLAAMAVVLAGFSLYLNRDWFAGDNIQIIHRSRELRFFRKGHSSPAGPGTVPIVFGFNRSLKLTSLKVVSVSDLATNKYPHALWHLVSESNSVPTKDFYYGSNIKGMHPAIKGARADVLEPGQKYRLLVETAAYKGQDDFTPVAKTP